MKKIIFLLILLTFGLFSTVQAANTWYACSGSGNINDASKFGNTKSGSTTCNCTGSSSYSSIPAANGDTLDASVCTGIAINVDPGSASATPTLTNGGTGNAATNFTLTMATLNGFSGNTAHFNVTGGGVGYAVLGLSGTTSSGTIAGNITGGSVGSAYGVIDTHSSGTVTVTGTVTGGSYASAAGWYQTGVGPSSINNCVGGTGVGCSLFYTGAATTIITVTGMCEGSNSASNAAGCLTNNSYLSRILVTGNMIDGLGTAGAQGSVLWAPASTTNYRLSPKDSNYTLGTFDSHAIMAAPMNSGSPLSSGIYTTSNVVSGVTYGTLTGTASGATVISGGAGMP